MMQDNPFFKESVPEYFFSEFPVSEIEYKFYFYDISDFKLSPFNDTDHNYFMLIGYAFENYSEPFIAKDKKIKVHFPVFSFFKQWGKQKIPQLIEENHIDIELHFKRTSKRIIQFTQLKIFDKGNRRLIGDDT